MLWPWPQRTAQLRGLLGEPQLITEHWTSPPPRLSPATFWCRMDGQSWPILPQAQGRDSNFSSQRLKLLVQKKIIKHAAVPNRGDCRQRIRRDPAMGSFTVHAAVPHISPPRAPGMPATLGHLPRKQPSFLLLSTSIPQLPREGLVRRKILGQRGWSSLVRQWLISQGQALMLVLLTREAHAETWLQVPVHTLEALSMGTMQAWLFTLPVRMLPTSPPPQKHFGIN